MSIAKNTSKQLLASILAAAGIYGNANAAECPQGIQEYDEITSEQIIRALAEVPSADLDAILNTKSVDDLSSEQKTLLLQLVQRSAKKLMFSAKPIV